MGRRPFHGGDWLFRHQSCAVRAGDTIGLTGAIGSGKTLLLRSLAMIDPLDEGVIEWQGEPVTGPLVPRFRAQVIYLHQSAVLFSGTVEDNFRHPFQLNVHRHESFQRQVALRWLSEAGGDESMLHRPARSLSGGERQVVALVRAILLSPTVLLLDEPTASLDAKTAHAVEELIVKWQRMDPRGRAYVWVTHSRPGVSRVADRLWTLERGKLEECLSHGE